MSRVSRLEHLIELDEVRWEIKAVDKQRIECERYLADLRNHERDLRRQIEREAHL